MKIIPPLDRWFSPAVLRFRDYRALVAADPASRALGLALVRPDGTGFRHDLHVIGAAHPRAAETLVHVERHLKFLLWMKGAPRVLVAGAPEVAAYLKREYSAGGTRAFDAAFMGGKAYDGGFSVEAVESLDTLPAAAESATPCGRNTDGCRIGFDLGGSSRKVVAMIDGEVVFADELPWDPYFQTDPAYHIEGVHEALARAAAHLPRVDAIGGGAAGVYVNNEVRVASLFRGVSQADFDRDVRRMFFTLRERWGGVPFEVANDGEVAALAASMALGANGVLGLSMGTSLAGGYVTPAGGITSWLNELAFAPVDLDGGAPRDEWSGDAGCGVQYFSLQAAARLAEKAGMVFERGMSAADRLREVHRAMAAGDARARAVFENVGVCFGYALAHYADYYALDHVLVLGGVMAGEGGAVIVERARAVLEAEFPELAGRLVIHTSDERGKRHAQAVAAASLPSLARSAPIIFST